MAAHGGFGGPHDPPSDVDGVCLDEFGVVLDEAEAFLGLEAHEPLDQPFQLTDSVTPPLVPAIGNLDCQQRPAGRAVDAGKPPPLSGRTAGRAVVQPLIAKSQENLESCPRTA